MVREKHNLVVNDTEQTQTKNFKSLNTKKKVTNLTVIPDETFNDETSSDIKTPSTPLTPTAKRRADRTTTGEKKSLQRLKSKQGKTFLNYSFFRNTQSW